MEEIVGGVAGEAEFGEQDEYGLARSRFIDQVDGVRAIESGISDAHRRYSDCYADEAVIMEIEKVLSRVHVQSSRRVVLPAEPALSAPCQSLNFSD
jgi:hypothetical protein